MLLEGKTAIITGAASGIGRATALLFAHEGAKVVVADIDAQGGKATAEAIRQAGGDAFFQPIDVAKLQEHQALVQATLERYGRLDVVYSNAGLNRMGSATELSEADWDLVLNVNLKAAWMLAKYAIPPMLRQEQGAFLVTSSIQAIEGFPRHIAYQAAKGGLVALTRALAADYAPTIRANAILPGGVVTGMWAQLSESQRAARAARIPVKRNGHAEDIANVALFLASDLSAYITGACIVVDGGRTSMELNWPE